MPSSNWVRNARYDLLLILPVDLVGDCGRFLDCAAGLELLNHVGPP